ncbi:hypothetical protein AB0H42_09385 [Nocardia sp. NPDC050799]|uniref:hypothetical protein n=1 Tax=Nocardia sp. NPDC050799 TaxID=3154842 RepID=UPI0033F480C7
MVIYDDNARPRVVVQGFDSSHPFAAVLEKYAGMVDYHDGMQPLRWQSRDALVSMGRPDVLRSDSRHLRVIQIGGTPIGVRQYERNMSYPGIDLPFGEDTSYGEELELPDDVEGEWRHLTRTQLVPALKEMKQRPGFRWRDEDETRACTPFVRDLDGLAFAMRYRPHDGPLDCIYLPEDAIEDFTPWVLAAFKDWAVDAPGIFPAEPEWVADPQWMTPAEIEAAATLAGCQAEAYRVAQEMELKVTTAEAHFTEAREAADATTRVLLTGTGDGLVNELEALFTRLGFSVLNMDGQGNREKREDLRVSWESWTAIAEAKGYTAGGKPGDLPKIERFAGLYAVENRELPAAKWYIVNQFRDRDPSTRRPLMRNHSADVEDFAQGGGLVLDTRDLFLLDKAVTSGQVSQDVARQTLMKSAGFFELPTTLTEGPESE